MNMKCPQCGERFYVGPTDPLMFCPNCKVMLQIEAQSK